MKKILLILCCFFITTLAYAESLDRIVAVVNDSPIMQSELDDALAIAKKQIVSMNTSMPPANVLRKQVLQQLIDKKLQLQLAAQAGVKVSKEQLDQTIQHIADENKVTVAQLYEQLQTEGMSIKQYRKEMHDQMVLQQVQQHEVGAKITITPQEVNNFMHSKVWQASNTNKEYHIEDLVVTLPDSPTSDQIQTAKKQADAILTKIHSGNTFKTVVTTESSTNKTLQSNDLGWRKLPEIPTAFSEQVIHMQVNDVAGPIQTSNGFHIIHLAAAHDTTTTAENTKQVEQLLYQRKIDDQLQTWVTKLRSQAYINMNPETG